MPRLLLRGADLGEVEAVLFDKDGTLSHSEPDLLNLAQARVSACLDQVDRHQRLPCRTCSSGPTACRRAPSIRPG
jgi:phosphoglycolate phosphatase